MTRKPANDNDFRMEDFADSLRGLRESRQRAARLVEHFLRQTPQDVAEFLQTMAGWAQSRSEFRMRLHLDVLRHRDLLARLGYETLAEVYRVAVERDFTEVTFLMRSDRNTAEGFEAKPEGFAKLLGSLTLGQRKQLGRNAGRNELEFLLFDENRSVIRELLLNPRLNRNDVVRIAARHEAPPAVLEEILRSDRWSGDYAVRKALVFNPNLPGAYTANLINHLRREDLRDLLRARRLNKAIRELVKRKLAHNNDEPAT